MGLLRFLSRLAFICNLCWLLVSFSQWLPKFPDNAITSNIIVLAWIGGSLLNILLNTILLLLLLVRRLRKSGIPIWLMIVNFIFFALQLTVFILNRNLK